MWHTDGVMTSPAAAAAFTVTSRGNALSEEAVAILSKLGRHQGPPAIVLTGFAVDDAAVGPTPASWKERIFERTQGLDDHLVAVAKAIGSPFAWPTQQDGRLVHEIVPTAGHENDQLGSGSEARLLWHTEDAFAPDRPGFVALMCVRNDDGIGTSVGTLPLERLDDAILQVLREPRFAITPDPSHLAAANTTSDDSAFGRIDDMFTAPDAIPVVFGEDFIRLDPAYMRVADSKDTPAQEALDAVYEVVESTLCDAELTPGAILLLDNYRAVHGRKAFHARYNGRDRWLKRVNIHSS